MKLSLLEILEVTGGGEIGGTPDGNAYSSFHTDSRQVKQGGGEARVCVADLGAADLAPAGHLEDLEETQFHGLSVGCYFGSGVMCQSTTIVCAIFCQIGPAVR